MPLYLVQQGLALQKDIDSERGLSEDGIADVRRIAETAKHYNVQVSQIFHSGKKRAKQTADIIAEALTPFNAVDQLDGINPNDEVSIIASKFKQQENMMLVGHLPFMERLVAYLIIGTVEPPLIKFQNGGIVCLDQDQENKIWFIKWTVMPKIG